PTSHYPLLPENYDFDTPPKPWVVKNLEYRFPTLDTLATVKQVAPLPVAGFNELNLVVDYINGCVGSMENLAQELRSEEYTWETLRKPNRSKRKLVVKFEHFKVPITLYGLATKNSKNINPALRPSIMQ